MANKGSKKDNRKPTREPRIANRRAFHDYEISEKLEVGIELSGSEVKSIRNGRVSLAEGFALVDGRRMELYLHDVDIGPYAQAGDDQHEAKAVRKLLAHKREIEKLFGLTTGKGTTLVPLAMYFKHGRIKVELGVGKGKKQYDKRRDMRKKDADREIRRGMTRKVL